MKCVLYWCVTASPKVLHSEVMIKINILSFSLYRTRLWNHGQAFPMARLRTDLTQLKWVNPFYLLLFQKRLAWTHQKISHSWCFHDLTKDANTSTSFVAFTVCQSVGFDLFGCLTSFSAEDCKRRAKNVAVGWIVKLPEMWNCLAAVSSVKVDFRQIKAKNCNSLYMSVILNVSVFQREKLRTDVSLFAFSLHFCKFRTCENLVASRCWCLWLRHSGEKKNILEEVQEERPNWCWVILSSANCECDVICWRL